jgi:hypothetical protein
MLSDHSGLIQEPRSTVRVEPTIVPDVLQTGSGGQEVRTAMPGPPFTRRPAIWRWS